MDEHRTFPTGTQAACNRCPAVNALPKDCTGHLSHLHNAADGKVYRLETMCTLACGHMDAHWIILS